MIQKILKNKEIFCLILIIGFFILLRFINYSYPFYTSDEARIAYRGYTLATQGKDEFGRIFPILFNSAQDYQLPITSYFTAIGIFLFGKSTFGVTFPYLLLAISIIILTYKISKIFFLKVSDSLFSALFITLSPGILFLVRTPNEYLIDSFLYLCLFYLFLKQKAPFLIAAICMVLLAFTSKNTWIITPLFIIVTLFFYAKKISLRSKIILVITSLLISGISFFLFTYYVEQGSRSLKENNFTIYSDLSLQNGINRLRGQGVSVGWPSTVDRVLFNKTEFLSSGFIYWFSSVSPDKFFGQLDQSIFPRIYILLFLSSLVALAANIKNELKYLLLYPLIFTFPYIFLYPNTNPYLLTLSLPYIVFLIALGFNFLKINLIKISIICILLVEIIISFTSVDLVKRNIEISRQDWILPVLSDVYKESTIQKINISDDIIQDISSLLFWYTPFPNKNIKLPGNETPYRVLQTSLNNVTVIGSEAVFNECSLQEGSYLSQRDIMKIGTSLATESSRIYYDNQRKPKVYYFNQMICLK